MTYRESDYIIIPSISNSRSEGEGCDKAAKSSKETWTGYERPGKHANLTEENHNEGEGQ